MHNFLQCQSSTIDEAISHSGTSPVLSFTRLIEYMFRIPKQKGIWYQKSANYVFNLVCRQHIDTDRGPMGFGRYDGL